MRLILHHGILDLPKRPRLPDETFAFLCFEDFSVGPLGDWSNLSEFKKVREAFWHKSSSSVFDLPDGSKAPYFDWMQTLPRYDLVEMVKSGVDIEDIPLPLEFEDVAPLATTIEIWRDQSVSGEVFQWYLSAILPLLGTDLYKVTVCLFPNPISNKQPDKFWSDMLTDMPDRSIPAAPQSPSDWQQMLLCWESISNLPHPTPSTLIEKLDEHALHALNVLKERHPDALTGLTNIQTRILRTTPVDWRKMTRSLSDAMIAGQDVSDPLSANTLEAVLNEMTQMPRPLIEKRGAGPMHKCDVRLTSYGQRKLSQIG